jgi:N utilization substance protein B
MSNLRDDTFWETPMQEPLAPRQGRRGRGRKATREERMETRGRARALQALYAADLRDIKQVKRIATTVFDDLAIDPAERLFASRLVATVADRGDALDAALSEVTANWRLERLGVIERSVLRLAAAELAREETPVKVVLQEAVHLAERYGTERSARFVNGVLDAYARRLGRL